MMRNPRWALALIVGMGLATLPTRAHEDPANLYQSNRCPDLTGTTWEGVDVCGPQVFQFEKDHVFCYSYAGPNGGVWTTYRNGTWKQDGRSVYIETNRKFAERTGTIKGNRMEGVGWNVGGVKWKWNAQRRPDPSVLAPLDRGGP